MSARFQSAALAHADMALLNEIVVGGMPAFTICSNSCLFAVKWAHWFYGQQACGRAPPLAGFGGSRGELVSP
jgi:hypothetical protein